MTERRFKVTVSYYHKDKKVYRNRTSQQATALEREFVNQPKIIKNVRVENETNLKSVKDG